MATTAFDTEALRMGIEGRKASTLLSLYADDAEMRMVDHRSQPSHPMVAHGRTEIDAVLSDVYSRDMTHKLESVIVGDGHIAWMESCEYPDGTKVLCNAMGNIKDGKITDLTGIQAWDEA
ncbi:nuclear transport factor 2 family protein [Kitasatospora sp. NPDC002227]|uniref:nuclear transport factor 2 family protein n=1 Tax=Kitasatospora sp. NPDC002227 TaxID=3154773 RepID=UPI003330AF7E